MNKQASIAYRLRPNKAVDRELFLSLLGRLGAKLRLEKYTYIGLGGPFMEDFRLVHSRIGIDKMFCVESEKAVHLRQAFNRPVESVECIHDTIEHYLETTEFTTPVIAWLDYATPETVVHQLETFAQQLCELPIGSIVRITLNANPTSLGKPPSELMAVVLPGEQTEGAMGVAGEEVRTATDVVIEEAKPPTVPATQNPLPAVAVAEVETKPVVVAAAEEAKQPVAPAIAVAEAKPDAVPAVEEPKPAAKITEIEWRLARYKERLGGFCPNGITPDDMTHRKFGRSLLEALRLHAEREVLDHKERKLIWALATHYSDGQAMVTCTAIVVPSEDQEVGQIVQEWQYVSTPQNPLRLDMPALTTLERLTMESTQNPKERMGYELPKSDMGEDPFETFKRFYRVYPHFARVDV
jgi:hypothetical protein